LLGGGISWKRKRVKWGGGEKPAFSYPKNAQKSGRTVCLSKMRTHRDYEGLKGEKELIEEITFTEQGRAVRKPFLLGGAPRTERGGSLNIFTGSVEFLKG